METFFNIRYEFDQTVVHDRLLRAVQEKTPGYICVADGNILSLVHRDAEYRETVAQSMFSICDSSWVPIFLRHLYGIRRENYCGSQIFRDVISSGRYCMAFLGGSSEILRDLRTGITPLNPAVADMPFIEVPFLPVDEFDYEAIAAELNASGADIIWVSLGAPKQERFMQRLLPRLSKGIMIGVGAVFNFYSGHVRRAPAWWRSLHLEFLFRVFTEPHKQLPRCFGIISALPAILREEKSRQKFLCS